MLQGTRSTASAYAKSYAKSIANAKNTTKTNEMKVKTTNKGMLGQETDPINPFLPLTEKEQNSISSHFLNNILTDAVIGSEVILDLVSLKEPVKKEVLEFYETGVMPQRVAEVGVFYYTTDTYLSYNVVLVNGEIEKVSEPVTIKDARPSYNVPEEDLCYELIFSNEEFRNVLKLRGLTDYDIDNYVTLDTCFDSRIDLIDEKFGPNFSDFIYNRNPRPRIVYFAVFWSSGIPDTSKYYVQPIDEIIVFVDTLSKEIIKIYDSGTFDPIEKENVFWERPESNTLKPIITTLPEGPSYKLNQNEVEWADWKFTWSVHPVYGLMLYNATILDRTVWKEDTKIDPIRRSVFYKANFTEAVASYGDDSITGTVRNFLDLSEYPTRDFSYPLVPGIDVPEYADLLGVMLTSATGEVTEYANRVAIYERNNGNLWRHTSYDSAVEGRMSRQLVVSYLIVIGNYDYTLNWIFSMDGQIDVEIVASGIIETMSSKYETTSSEIKFAQLTGKHLIGTNHSHMFNVRIDFMVDGIKNSIEESDTLMLPETVTNPYGNQFAEKSTLLLSEKMAVRNADFTKSRRWIVHNEDSLNYLGIARGYELNPYPTPRMHNSKGRMAKRAGFLINNLYVTKYREGELYSMGKHSVEASADAGLEKYIENNENIEDEDLVVWYTCGFGHTPKCEDFPVMPREPFGFSLKPHNFFNENASLYMQKNV